ncbi:MAG: hypothetical protein JNG84_07100 [Archangium sp.]|nr:hypothetical protein [Archangium sp.]
MRLALAVLACAACAPMMVQTSAGPTTETSFFCRYQKNPIGLSPGVLELSGRPFGRFTVSPTVGLDLKVPLGPVTQPLGLNATTGWVTLRAQYRPTEGLRLHAVNPVTMGVYSLGRYGAYRSVGQRENRFELEPEASRVFFPTRPLRVQLTCEETSLTVPNDKGNFDQAEEPVDQVEVAFDVDIPVSATPGGTPVGRLRFTPELVDTVSSGPPAPPEPDVRLAAKLDERDGWVHIRADDWPGVVKGWVPQRFVKPHPPVDSGNGGIFGIGGTSPKAEKPTWPRCTNEVPLFIARGTSLERVGTVHPGAAVVQRGRLERWTEVDLPELAWLTLEPGVTWALAPDDLPRCLSTHNAPR